jgi:osmotically-inducible protein OsmY
MRAIGASAAALFIVVAAGCAHTAQGLQTDLNRNATATKAAVREAGREAPAAKQELSRIVNAGENAGQKAGSTAGPAVSLTPAVKTAIVSDSALNNPHNKIDVDSSGGVVKLSGHVVNKNMKQRATTVAQAALTKLHSSASVDNELTFGAG